MIYVCIIVFSSLVLGFEFLIDINGKEPYRELEPGFQGQYQAQIG